jgi:hypothetical protein
VKFARQLYENVKREFPEVKFRNYYWHAFCVKLTLHGAILYSSRLADSGTSQSVSV